jgi:hypothetical protein
MVTAVALVSILVVLGPGRAYAADPATIATALKTLYDFIKAGQSVINFIDGSVSLETLLEELKQDLIEELRDGPLVAEAEGLTEEYGEITRNPDHPETLGRLENFFTLSLITFNKFEEFITTGSGESVYNLLPAFNLFTVLRVGALKEHGYDQQTIDQMFKTALYVNHTAVGARTVTVTLPMPFGLPPVTWDMPTIELSKLWNSPRFADYWFFCYPWNVSLHCNLAEDRCNCAEVYYARSGFGPMCFLPFLERQTPACLAREAEQVMTNKYDIDGVVEVGREAMRQILALGYTEVMPLHTLVEP